jgi:hypothetical protein
MASTRVNLKVYQGSTFSQVLRWESSIKIYVPITAAFKGAPLVITANNHNLVPGWRTKISNVLGMTELNSLGYIIATSLTTNNVTYNAVNSTGYKDYISGGILEYNQPVSLADVSARMQIREKLNSTTIIDELVSTVNNDGNILISDDSKTISITMTATETTAYTFKTAVYSLELVRGAVVTPFVHGTITLEKEITR